MHILGSILRDLIFLGSKITAGVDCSNEIKTPAPWKESYDKPRQHIKKQRHYLADTGQSSQSYGFSRSHVWMWELDHKEGWALKNWCFQTVVLEKTPKSLSSLLKMFSGTQCLHCRGIARRWPQAMFMRGFNVLVSNLFHLRHLGTWMSPVFLTTHSWRTFSVQLVKMYPYTFRPHAQSLKL